MSDVLVKNMKMPKSCDQCRLWLLFLGRYICFGKGVEIDNEQFPYEFMSKDRLPDCPLVEVPPHGRLIDADKLREALLSDEDDRFFTIEDIDEVDNAPTVLEASNGTDNQG